MAQMVKVTCQKCNQTFTLNIGENTLDEVIETLKQAKGFQCTAGNHLELGSQWTTGQFTPRHYMKLNP